MTPNASNPNRAPTQGDAQDQFVVQFTAGANSNFLRQDGTWALPPGGGGGSVWGGITGTLSNQTDLQNALNLKANVSSLATVATTGAYSDLTGRPTLGTLAALSYPGGTSAFLRADGTWQIPVDVQAQWGNISGTLASQTDLNNALNLKAPLASPSLTGTPLSTTAALDTNTTQIATTAFYCNQAGSTNPAMNGTAASGTSLRFARIDHVHPSDTARINNVLTTTGDLVYSSSGATAARLGIGTAGQVLTVVAGAPQWQTATAGLPQNSQSANYTCVLGDANSHVYHPSADVTARTFTIPANASVAYPVGTTLTFVNDSSAGTVTIAITTDTLVLAGAGTTGSRTLAANGIATALKVTATRWQINGTGLT